MNIFLYRCKRHFQNIFLKQGIEIRRVRPETKPIDVFSLVVRDLMRRHGEKLFVIQIGAHDGMQYDPIRPWIEQYKWKGILVEPQPEIYQRLRQNYQNHPQLIFENSAISKSDGPIPFYQFEQDGVIPDHATTLASFDRHRVEHNGFNYKGKIIEVKIPGITPKSLLTKHNISAVDILQLDAEGFDYQILKMWDFQHAKPKLIHYESAALNAAELFASFTLLTSHGYSLATVGIDTIAYLEPAN